jgi:hypothetical protein
MSICFLWNAVSWILVDSYRKFRSFLVFSIKQSELRTRSLDCVNLKMKAPHSFETSVTLCHSTMGNWPETNPLWEIEIWNNIITCFNLLIHIIYILYIRLNLPHMVLTWGRYTIREQSCDLQYKEEWPYFFVKHFVLFSCFGNFREVLSYRPKVLHVRDVLQIAKLCILKERNLANPK